MKKILNIFLSSIVVIAIVTSCSEEGIDDNGGIGKLEGMVVKAGDNTPLEDVKISTSPASTTVFTDEEGKFEIEEIVAGSYSVQASLAGYQTTFKPARITQGLVANVVFELEPSTISNQPPSTPILITDRKSTRLNSSHVRISYAVFCLKKKKKKK